MTCKILAIETSTDHGSVAIADNENIRHQFMEADKKPSLSILAAIERLLAEAGFNKSQLDAISFGRGPGSFTGVRLATSVAQMIAFGLDIPIIPVSTLQALAQQGWRNYQYKQLVAALDARLNQVYWACYQYDASLGLVSLLGEERLGQIMQATWPVDSAEHWYGIGDGWKHATQETSSKLTEAYPSAYDIARIACIDYGRKNFMHASSVEPLYMRDKLVTVPN